MRANIRPELIEQAVVRYYRERPVELKPAQVAERTAAIESLLAVSQQAIMQVKAAKSELIGKLKAQQTRLLRLYAEEGDGASPNAFRDERVRLQAEITAAEQSLAETEQRLQLDADKLRMALELAEDVAEVYAHAPESIRRGYNQAFFKRLLIVAEWDDEHGQTIVRVADAELSEPYAVLLDKDLAADVAEGTKQLEAAATNAESGQMPLSDSLVSIFVKMAEGGRFELPVRR